MNKKARLWMCSITQFLVSFKVWGWRRKAEGEIKGLWSSRKDAVTGTVTEPHRQC